QGAEASRRGGRAAARLRVVQPDDARRRLEAAARGVRLRPGSRTSRRHVPAHAARRDRGAAREARLSDFFEPPPPPPEPPREHRQPEWFGPPENVLPVVVPLELELARGADFALAVRSADVYPKGAAFHVVLVLRQPPSDSMDFLPFHPRQRKLGPEVLRLGVQYADGAKATNVGAPFFHRHTE